MRERESAGEKEEKLELKYYGDKTSAYSKVIIIVPKYNICT